jgi:cysteinyl-tRNA synthetase
MSDTAELRAYLAKAKAARRALPERYPADFDWAVDVLEDALGEVERLENMLADCRKHRDRAEQNERHLLALTAQIHELVSDDEGEP